MDEHPIQKKDTCSSVVIISKNPSRFESQTFEQNIDHESSNSDDSSKKLQMHNRISLDKSRKEIDLATKEDSAKVSLLPSTSLTRYYTRKMNPSLQNSFQTFEENIDLFTVNPLIISSPIDAEKAIDNDFYQNKVISLPLISSTIKTETLAPALIEQNCNFQKTNKIFSTISQKIENFEEKEIFLDFNCCTNKRLEEVLSNNNIRSPATSLLITSTNQKTSVVSIESFTMITKEQRSNLVQEVLDLLNPFIIHESEGNNNDYETGSSPSINCSVDFDSFTKQVMFKIKANKHSFKNEEKGKDSVEGALVSTLISILQKSLLMTFLLKDSSIETDFNSSLSKSSTTIQVTDSISSTVPSISILYERMCSSALFMQSIFDWFTESATLYINSKSSRKSTKRESTVIARKSDKKDNEEDTISSSIALTKANETLLSKILELLGKLPLTLDTLVKYKFGKLIKKLQDSQNEETKEEEDINKEDNQTKDMINKESDSPLAIVSGELIKQRAKQLFDKWSVMVRSPSPPSRYTKSKSTDNDLLRVKDQVAASAIPLRRTSLVASNVGDIKATDALPLGGHRNLTPVNLSSTSVTEKKDFFDLFSSTTDPTKSLTSKPVIPSPTLASNSLNIKRPRTSLVSSGAIKSSTPSAAPPTSEDLNDAEIRDARKDVTTLKENEKTTDLISIKAIQEKNGSEVISEETEASITNIISSTPISSIYKQQQSESFHLPTSKSPKTESFKTRKRVSFPDDDHQLCTFHYYPPDPQSSKRNRLSLQEDLVSNQIKPPIDEEIDFYKRQIKEDVTESTWRMHPEIQFREPRLLTNRSFVPTYPSIKLIPDEIGIDDSSLVPPTLIPMNDPSGTMPQPRFYDISTNGGGEAKFSNENDPSNTITPVASPTMLLHNILNTNPNFLQALFSPAIQSTFQQTTTPQTASHHQPFAGHFNKKMQQQQFQNQQQQGQICKFYRSFKPNSCRNGKNCKFLHIDK